MSNLTKSVERHHSTFQNKVMIDEYMDDQLACFRLTAMPGVGLTKYGGQNRVLVQYLSTEYRVQRNTDYRLPEYRLPEYREQSIRP